MRMDTYFFDTDGDGHNYMIPVYLRDEWADFKKMDIETDNGYKSLCFFEYYRMDGIEGVEFIPINI